MRLDQGLELEKQTLDVTPLIDIIFLLVLFFAVSSSFISGDDLQKLRTSVVDLTRSSETLNAELSASVSENDGLKNQLGDLVSEAERRKQQEQLLNQLLGEQQQENNALRTEQTALSGKNADLLQQLSTLQGLLQNRDDELASASTQVTSAEQQRSSLEEQLAAAAQSIDDLTQKLAMQLQETTRTQDSLDAREVLLQKLIAEKAAELKGLQVRLETADAARVAVEKELESKLESERASREQLLAEAQQARTTILQLQAELEKFQGLADADRAQIESALKAQQTLSDGMRSYLENNSFGISRDQQRLTLNLSDKLLFSSGSSTIKPGGLEILRDLGSLLSERADELEILVSGHTDNIPVSGALGNNWNLSAVRAVNVVRFFESELGIESDRMAAVGYGEHRPIASNSTADGRGKNRRIEIVLVPR